MTFALVVDDELSICRCFQTLFEQLDCEVSVAATAEEAIRIAANHSVDIIVLDIRLPGMDGLTAISRLRELTGAPIIVMTAHGNLSTAVSAVQQGAFDYLPKPFELEHVTRVVRLALADHAATPVSDSQAKSSRSDRIVGESLPMQQLFRQIALAAQHDAPVLITGESGTGKELVASAIHRSGPRGERAYIPVHLASVNESLIERELFGHAAGAFTGADQAVAGLIKQANGGSLFLDEIGEASPAVQVKLLRTIETGEFYRVGSSKAEQSDFRVIAATNRPIEFLKGSPQFRLDFFYRLCTLHIHVPPLRERRDDIPLLATYFLNGSLNGPRRFSSDALEELKRRQYTGNVRELRNIVVSAGTQSLAAVLGPELLPAETGEFPVQDRQSDLKSSARAWARQALAEEVPGLLSAAIKIVETECIAEALEQLRNNRSAAAQRLGIHRETLREKIQDSETL